MGRAADFPVFVPVGVATLLRVRFRALGNHLTAVMAESPLKVAGTAGFVVLIWAGLYGLFRLVFEYLETTPLESVVAIPLVFNFFFVSLLILLTFSNALLAYSALFGREEAAYLLTAPISRRAFVTVQYLEVLFFSSWSLILLGIPLMAAMSRTTREPDLFYPLFLAFFLLFVPIPGAAGLVLAWLTARFLPRSIRKTLITLVAAGALVTAVWALRTINTVEVHGGDWLNGFFFRMNFVQSALLPSTWITRGIEHALNNRLDQSVMYLLLVLANTLFLSWLAVGLTARRFASALDRASTGRGGSARLPAQATGGALGAVFFYLPHPVRIIALKDLRTFLRDPLQWSQLVILFGLMGLYLVNMPRFQVELLSERWALLVPLLNLSAIGFILATFTSRFVFPLVSLEGHQFWLVGLLPMDRSRLLHAKFAFAMTVSVFVAVGAMGLATYVLRIPKPWAAIHLLVTFAVCVGLCGCAVGLGARLPLFAHRNPARIANGLGGTINLIASVLLVLSVLGGVGSLSWRAYQRQLDAVPDTVTWLGVAVIVLVVSSAGMAAMRFGSRHLARMEL